MFSTHPTVETSHIFPGSCISYVEYSTVVLCFGPFLTSFSTWLRIKPHMTSPLHLYAFLFKNILSSFCWNQNIRFYLHYKVLAKNEILVHKTLTLSFSIQPSSSTPKLQVLHSTSLFIQLIDLFIKLSGSPLSL